MSRSKRETTDEYDLYYEEVDSIVENIAERIGEDISTTGTLTMVIEQAVELSNYCHDEFLAGVVLRHSKYPTAYFAEFGFDRSAENIDINGTTAFPWKLFAGQAMLQDVRNRLTDKYDITGLRHGDDEEGDDE